jgi:hypothetical protein
MVMNNKQTTPDPKELVSKRLYHPRIKRIRQEARQQIGRLLRSFVPLIPRKQQDNQTI